MNSNRNKGLREKDNFLKRKNKTISFPDFLPVKPHEIHDKTVKCILKKI